MSTVEIGRAAETQAADYLQAQGFRVVGRNWRNRWCEIDLIMRRGTQLHFIEVKYRSDVRYGYAAEYISRDKAARLMRAALAWCQAHRYDGPYQIDVIAVEGPSNRPAITVYDNVITA